MKLTAMSNEVFEYVKNNGGRVSIEELCEAIGRTARSINANVTDLCSERKGLCVREKVAVDGQDKPTVYVVLTEAGKTFVPSDDAE